MKVKYLWMIVAVVTISLFPRMAVTQEQNAFGLKVDMKAPDFIASSYEGDKITLSDTYKKGPVVLIFYRGEWCPMCNIHLKSFQGRLEDFKNLNATIIAVSVDKQEYGTKIVQKDALGFEVVSDPDAEILQAYNVVYKVSEELAQKYLNEYHIDLEAHSGRKDHVIAVPATYVIDQSGKIVFAYANEDYKVRTKPEEVLEVLNKMNQEK